jgi:voltage-gated potassium channel
LRHALATLFRPDRTRIRLDHSPLMERVHKAAVDRARWRLLANLAALLEPIMSVLGIVWLLLLVVEFTRGLTPAMTIVSRAIWAIFILDFLLEWFVAPRKRLYLRRNWLVALSLALPALRSARLVRVLRLGRGIRALRGVRLLRTLTSFNRGMAALRVTMRRRGFGYVSALTLLVTVLGAAAMFAFERDVPDPAGLHDFSTALWWTAMIMTTMGSAYWPQTTEGRLLCVALALYAFAVFGYLTAMLATFFVSRDTAKEKRADTSIDDLRQQVEELLRLVRDRLPAAPRSGESPTAAGSQPAAPAAPSGGR